jgi:succinate dehydrogenase / fumarate reductase cytochrome b subunit
MSLSTAQAKPRIAPAPVPLTSVGAKVVVAVTGLVLTAFVIVHMIGNLQIFLGPEPLNAYAHFLKSVPELLWAARVSLLTIFVLHVVFAVQLRLHSHEARKTPYVYERKLVTSRSATYMLLTGLMVLFFLLYHLAHFTLGWTQTVTITENGAAVTKTFFELTDPTTGHQDVYSMVVRGFQNYLIAGLYIVAQLLLASHLYHGVSSAMQTLGVNNRRLNTFLSWLGPVVAGVIAVGNCSIPVAVLTGLIGLPNYGG